MADQTANISNIWPFVFILFNVISLKSSNARPIHDINLKWQHFNVTEKYPLYLKSCYKIHACIHQLLHYNDREPLEYLGLLNNNSKSKSRQYRSVQINWSFGYRDLANSTYYHFHIENVFFRIIMFY